MGNMYFLRRGNQVIGPMTGAALRELAADGKVTPADYVRRDDTNWFRVTEVDDLSISSPVPVSNAHEGILSQPNAVQPIEGAADRSDSRVETRSVLLQDTTNRTFGIVVLCSLGALALSALMPWVQLFGGGISGIRGDGRFVLVLSLVVLIASMIGAYRPQWFTPIASLCMAWGTVAAVWMAALLYKTATGFDPDGLQDNPLAIAASAQVGPGLGLFVGLISGISTAIFAGLLCVRSATRSNANNPNSRFNWLATGQAVAIPISLMLILLRFSDSGTHESSDRSALDSREQKLLADSDRVLADLQDRISRNEAHTARVRNVTAKEERVHQLTRSGTNLLDAWQQVGLLSIDFEARKVVVNSTWWEGWSQKEGGRTSIVNILGMTFRTKTGSSALTVYEDEYGHSVGMVHSDGEVVIFR